ncbi:MAG TPA: hypothetical protein VFA81_10325 [Burkholderiales bacterium]|nr:hypothetical protein [Burkholderiales bacterium]
MNLILLGVLVCGMVASSLATGSAEQASEAVAGKQVLSNAAQAAASRAQCQKRLSLERNGECEDSANLCQQGCMAEVLEALRTHAGRAPLRQN